MENVERNYKMPIHLNANQNYNRYYGHLTANKDMNTTFIKFEPQRINA